MLRICIIFARGGYRLLISHLSGHEWQVRNRECFHKEEGGRLEVRANFQQAESRSLCYHSRGRRHRSSVLGAQQSPTRAQARSSSGTHGPLSEADLESVRERHLASLDQSVSDANDPLPL